MGASHQDVMKRVCDCGHMMEDHMARRVKGLQPCTFTEFSPDFKTGTPCRCESFRRQSYRLRPGGRSSEYDVERKG